MMPRGDFTANLSDSILMADQGSSSSSSSSSSLPGPRFAANLFPVAAAWIVDANIVLGFESMLPAIVVDDCVPELVVASLICLICTLNDVGAALSMEAGAVGGRLLDGEVLLLLGAMFALRRRGDDTAALGATVEAVAVTTDGAATKLLPLPRPLAPAADAVGVGGLGDFGELVRAGDFTRNAGDCADRVGDVVRLGELTRDGDLVRLGELTRDGDLVRALAVAAWAAVAAAPGATRVGKMTFSTVSDCGVEALRMPACNSLVASDTLMLVLNPRFPRSLPFTGVEVPTVGMPTSVIVAEFKYALSSARDTRSSTGPASRVGVSDTGATWMRGSWRTGDGHLSVNVGACAFRATKSLTLRYDGVGITVPLPASENAFSFGAADLARGATWVAAAARAVSGPLLSPNPAAVVPSRELRRMGAARDTARPRATFFTFFFLRLVPAVPGTAAAAAAFPPIAAATLSGSVSIQRSRCAAALVRARERTMLRK